MPSEYETESPGSTLKEKGGETPAMVAVRAIFAPFLQGYAKKKTGTK